MNDVRIRWLLDVIDQGGPKQLLAQDRQLQKSLVETDALYKRTSSTATGVAARQVQASRQVAQAVQGEGRARVIASDEVARYSRAQREALLIGSQVIRQSGQVEKGYSKQGAAATRAGHASESASRKTKHHAEEAVAANALLTGSFTRMARTAVTAGLGFTAAYIGISKAKSAVEAVSEFGHEAELLHRNLGLTIKSASLLAGVLKARGVDFTSYSMGFQTLSRNAEAAVEGSTKQMKAFHELGVTQDDLVKGQTDFAFLLGKTADGFHNLSGGVDRAALAQQLLGRGQRTLLPILNEGRQGLVDQLSAADKLGVGLDAKALPKLEELRQAQIQLAEASLGVKIGFTEAAIPAMLSLSGVAQTVARDLHGPGSFDDKLGKVGQDLAPQLTKVEHLFEAAIPHIADAVGRDSPKIAMSFVHGFEHADVWGRSVLGLIVLKKIGALGVGGGLLARGLNNAGSAAAGYFASAFSKKAAIELEASMAGETAVAEAIPLAPFRAQGAAAGAAFATGVAGAVGFGLGKLGDKLEAKNGPAMDPRSGHTIGVSPGQTPFQEQAAAWVKNLLGNIFRGGGTVQRFAGGGLVPAMVSPGEMLAYGGGSMYVPGPSAAADNVLAMVPPGTAVFTHSGQAMLASGYSPADALAHQAPHFAGGGSVPSFDFSQVPTLQPIPKNLPKQGQSVLASDPAKAPGASGSFIATAYGPPWTGINGGGITATGVDLRQSPHVPIVAVDPSVIPLHSKLHVWPNPFGQKNLTFLAEDTGSAIKGHHLDIYDWKGRGDQMAWGSKQVAVSVAGSGRKGSSPVVQYGSELVAGPLRAQLRTLLGAQIDRQRLMSPLVADAYSRGYDIGLAGGRNVYDILPDVGSATGIGSIRTHQRVRTVSIFGGRAGSPKGGAGQLSAIRGAASAINAQHYNYEWGGGHNPSFTPTHGSGHGSGPGVGYDCSGAISSILNAAGLLGSPLTSGDFMTWGAKGTGKSMSIYAGPSHVFSKIGNRYFGTSGSQNPGGGAGWFSRFPGMPPGGVVRHPPGLRRGGRVGSYRTGGSVGAQVFGGSGLTGISTLDNTGATRILKSLVTSITDISYGGVIALMRRIRSTIAGYLSDHVVTPREQAQTLRLRGALTLAQAEVGRRIGVGVAAAQQRYANAQQYGTFGAAALSIRGVDTSSASGLGEQNAILIAQKKQYERVAAELNKQYARAPASLKPQIASVMQGVGQDILQTTVQIAQNARAQVQAAAQEGVDKAQFGVDYAQGVLSGLDISQRLSGTADQPHGGTAEKAAAIQATLLPALYQSRTAAYGSLAAAQQTGDQAGIRAAELQIQQAGNDIASAMADAADLLRQGAEQAAQYLVDKAAHGTSMASLGEAHLELEQRLSGTFDTAGQQRADYIQQTLIPALSAELDALQKQQQTAATEGDQKLADQIGEAVAGKQNDILQASLDAQEAIKANTDPRKFGGTTGFPFGGETLTDQLIAVGNGS